MISRNLTQHFISLTIRMNACSDFEVAGVDNAHELLRSTILMDSIRGLDIDVSKSTMHKDFTNGPPFPKPTVLPSC